MSRLSRSSHIALWAAIFSLLLKAAVPLLAATAAELRGVPVASVCAIYGVAMPALGGGGGGAAHGAHVGHIEHTGSAESTPHAEHGGDVAQAAHAEHSAQVEHPAHADPQERPAHAPHGSGAADAQPAAPAHAALHAHAGPADPASHPGDPTHADDKHGASHCALTALAALAVPDPAIAVVPRVRDDAPAHALNRAVAFHDASAAWIARLKHGPPAAA